MNKTRREQQEEPIYLCVYIYGTNPPIESKEMIDVEDRK